MDLLTYLRSAGWHKEAEMGQRAELWIKADNGHGQDVLVPLRREAGDYALRASEFLRTLELVENRSQQQIVEDIGTVSADIIRIRSVAHDSQSGSISINSGVAFVAEAREMILAAACATVWPRPYWARRKPVRAIEYLEKVRLGQTERGSYIVTIQSPVPPALRADVESDAPFERQVIETLSDALVALHSAAHQAVVTGDLDPFRSSVQDGVSANLCDAIVRLFEASPMNELDVSVSWSRSRPSARGPGFRKVLSADFIPVIAEASRLFKETAPEEDFELFGLVERLDRAAGMRQGQIFVNAVIEDRARRVAIELNEPEYQSAVLAHARRLPISCLGDLVRMGRSYTLQNARDFRVVEVDER
jgi:hypothetical protein